MNIIKQEPKPFKEPCGGCGETDSNKRCLNCWHEMEIKK